MTLEKDIEHKLEELGQAIGSDESMIENVIRRINSKSITSPSTVISQNIWRTIMKSPITKLAAAAMVIIALLILFSDSQTTLYAQVIKALNNARTIHVVSKRMHNGQWEKATEIWYQSGVGEKRIVWRKDKKVVRINNGKYQWEYSSNNAFASREKSPGIIQLPSEIIAVEKYLKMCERDSAGDKDIDGFSCKLYTATRRSDSHGTRVMFWVDTNKRLRRFKEYILRDGQWIDDEIAEVEYDVQVNQKIFIPDFGADIKIVKAGEELDKYFSLENAVFVREELGFIFAVHKIKKCEGDMSYVVCTIRPTEETKRKVKEAYKGPKVWCYGSFNLGSSWKRLDSSGRGCSYQPVNLGHIYHAGLQARLALLVPKGSWPEQINKCELEVRINVIGEQLKKIRTNNGLSCDERFKPMATLSLPKDKTSLEQVLEEVYSLTRTLESVVGFAHLTLKSVPWTDEEMDEYIKKYPDSGETRAYRSGDKSIRLHHGRTSKPSNISKDDWIKDRFEYLKEIRDR